jgi:hypothetical protein
MAPMTSIDPILAPIKGADHRVVAGVTLDIVPAGDGRVKRVIYPKGFRWSRDMKALVGTDLCMHAHVGFLIRGRIHVRYADGCVEEFAAPQVMAIQPGHDGWVDGDEDAVIVEFDFLNETASRFGMPAAHRHG